MVMMMETKSFAYSMHKYFPNGLERFLNIPETIPYLSDEHYEILEHLQLYDDYLKNLKEPTFIDSSLYTFGFRDKSDFKGGYSKTRLIALRKSRNNQIIIQLHKPLHF